MSLDPQDPAEWNTTSYEHHPVEDIEPVEDTPSKYTAEEAITRVMLMALKGKTLAEIGIRIKIFALLCGNAISEAAGCTQSSLAESCGITRQAMSKKSKEIMADMGMRINPNFKRQSASESYRLYNKKSRIK